tara:strand:+ start:175 stop:351 length:177 start_codon:yes stop_codon:yes gene_type:complete
MNIGEKHKTILLELITTAIEGVSEDLDNEKLSDQGATVLSERHSDLYFIARMIEESRW